MAAEKADTITSPVGTAYFEHVLQPAIITRKDKKTGQEKQIERYEMYLVFEPGTDLSEVEALILREAQSGKKFPATEAKQVLARQPLLAAAQSQVNNIDASASFGPIQTEGTPAGKYYPAGSKRIHLTSNQKSGAVVSFRKDAMGRADTARPDEVYSGMRCRVRISAYSFANEQKGVGLNLGHVQVVDATAPRLGRAQESIDDVFSADATAEVSTAPPAAEANALV